VKPVRIARKALTDLHGIRAYVAAENPTATEQLLQAFQEAFAHLADFPQMGHVRPDLTSKPVRFLTVQGYMVIYPEDSATLNVIRIVRGSRDIPTVLR
jgi:plasmid stabilization system protein ParE